MSRPIERRGGAGQGHLPRPGDARVIAGIDCVWAPPGAFLMGSPEDEAERCEPEGPRRRVTLTRGFWIAKHPVTQGQWRAVMGDNPAHFRGGPSHPVEQVSWHDCQAFMVVLNALTGSAFRLPTEAEWEYACRAGSTAAFAYGAVIHTGLANYAGDFAYGKAGRSGAYLARTTRVGRYRPNAWGLYDMHGNVWEWCADWYGEDYYWRGPSEDPKGPRRGLERVMRGGSWCTLPSGCRSACRVKDYPETASRLIGFRLVHP